MHIAKHLLSNIHMKEKLANCRKSGRNKEPQNNDNH